MFDSGYSLILVYLLGGLAGTVYETVLDLYKKKGFMICSGSIVTPFNFVYGFGGIVIFSTFFKLEPYFLTYWCWIVIFIAGSFIGGIVEYILSFLEEKIFHTKSWDYTGKVGSINGRTTIPIMLGWGILCLFVVYAAFIPVFNYLLEPLVFAYEDRLSIYHLVLTIIICVCAVDLCVTIIAMARYTYRYERMNKFITKSKFLDILFSDIYMSLHFPNARKTQHQRSLYSLNDLRLYNTLRKQEIGKYLYNTKAVLQEKVQKVKNRKK